MRKMKNSGIEWTKTKVKYCCSMISGDGITSQVISDTKDADNIYPVYGGNGQRGYYSQYNRDGNYILIGRQGALAGNVHRTQGKIWAADHAIVVTCNNKTDIGFMYYLFIMMDLNRYAQDTAAQPGLAVSKIMSLSCIISNIEIQKKIATYIERKYIEIEAIENELQHQIELLQEYKQSVITEAVTKGLDKNVAMKDCGVEWIGKISSKANIIRLKHFSYMKGRIGWQGLKSTDFIDEGPYCITGTDFINGQVNWDTCYHVSEERYQMDPYIQVKIGDLLVTKDGTIGKMAIISKLPTKACLNSHLLIVRPLNNKFTNKYLYYVMLSDIFSHYYSLVSNGSTMDSLSQEKMGNFSFPIYNIDIQHIITDYLDRKCAEIDAVLADKQKQLDTLTEYKKSLIYEYVTGKKEVPADA